MITGYIVYLNGSLYYDGQSDNTFTNIIITGLSLGSTYVVNVSAVTYYGNSPNVTLITKAATLPF